MKKKVMPLLLTLLCSLPGCSEPLPYDYGSDCVNMMEEYDLYENYGNDWGLSVSVHLPTGNDEEIALLRRFDASPLKVDGEKRYTFFKYATNHKNFFSFTFAESYKPKYVERHDFYGYDFTFEFNTNTDLKEIKNKTEYNYPLSLDLNSLGTDWNVRTSEYDPSTNKFMPGFSTSGYTLYISKMYKYFYLCADIEKGDLSVRYKSSSQKDERTVYYPSNFNLMLTYPVPTEVNE